MTQDNLILPVAPPVGGLPISQDWLDRMKLVRNRTIPIILPSGKNILVDTMSKIIIGYTSLGMRQIRCRLGSREREREMFYLTMHSTHFIYGYMVSDIWLRTILIVRKETRCHHIGYSY